MEQSKDEIISNWLLTLSERTRITYEKDIKEFEEFHGANTERNVKYNFVKYFTDVMKEKYKATTLFTKYSTLCLYINKMYDINADMNGQVNKLISNWCLGVEVKQSK
jgi:hypothetical protein